MISKHSKKMGTKLWHNNPTTSVKQWTNNATLEYKHEH